MNQNQHESDLSQNQHESDLKRRKRAVWLAAGCTFPILILFLSFSHLSHHQYDLFDWLATLCLVMLFPGQLITFIFFAARPRQKISERRSRWRDGGRI